MNQRQTERMLFVIDVMLYIIVGLLVILGLVALNGCAAKHHEKLPPNAHIEYFNHCQVVSVDAKTHMAHLECPTR